ncbi:hypothetical protein [Nocardia sp. BMG51109]|nr:hypothetical protein [Nocardia sp. BMG51109]
MPELLDTTDRESRTDVGRRNVLREQGIGRTVHHERGIGPKR